MDRHRGFFGSQEPTSVSTPRVRPRRLRRTPALRSLVRETQLQATDFIYPLFVVHGRGVRQEINSMPGVYHLSLDELAREVADVGALGIPGVLLFGLPAHKDVLGSEDYDPAGIVQQAIRTIRQENPELLVVTDVCMCQYTDHGHCGIIRDGRIDNDATLKYLAMTAISHADAGADIVAPSAMMDGQVGAIRAVLDDAGFYETAILAYAAKYASSFYGPFREAADSPPKFGDRRQYQMDPPNAREALREVALDIAEGADMVMVKPALAYLDVIHQVRQNFNVPLAAYNVSGEYSMIKAAARNGWLNERQATLELLTGIKRAGADVILSYHALEVARWLNER
ncbi:MAG: porphobilinogen synthase, partial [Chloroflexi bacterium]|nr:porphobilinogen synthase [Chloroflexota bacterium]